MENNSDLIYEAIVKIFNLKFKAQYNKSPIVFEKFLRVENIISGNEQYVLMLDSNKTIIFLDRAEFVAKFIIYLESELTALDHRYDTLQKVQREERWVDENAIFLEHEEIGYNVQRLAAMIKKFKSFEKL